MAVLVPLLVVSGLCSRFIKVFRIPQLEVLFIIKASGDESCLHTSNLSDSPLLISQFPSSSMAFVWLTLLPSFYAAEGSCDYIKPTQIIQINFSIFILS